MADAPTTGKSIEVNKEAAQGNSETTSAHHNRYTKNAYFISFIWLLQTA